MQQAVKLAYAKFAPKVARLSAPPVAILHGVLGSKLNWRSTGKKLSDLLERTIYVLDARNHGGSPHVSNMSYESMSEDTVMFMREHGGGSWTLIGHSMGGKTAMVTALRYPHLVEKLVVVDIAPARVAGLQESLHLVRTLESVELGSVQNRRDVEEQIIDSVPNEMYRQFFLTNLVKNSVTGLLEWKVNLSAIRENLNTLKEFPHFNNYYSGQTLFIGGEESSYLLSSQIPAIKRLFPNSTVTGIPGAGHWLHHEKPIEFLTELTKFLT